jgi:hypothetical protein
MISGGFSPHWEESFDGHDGRCRRRCRYWAMCVSLREGEYFVKEFDQLDTEYNRINNLGRWVKKDDSQVLALTSMISTLQSQLSSLTTQYKSLHALIANPTLQQPTPSPIKDKLQKPPPRKPDGPEITEFNGLVWKWCDKCFNGCWNRTHVTAEHVVGIGKRNRRRQSVTNNNDNNNNNSNNNNSPQANLASTPPLSPTNSDSSIPPVVQANVATTSTTSLDFM